MLAVLITMWSSLRQTRSTHDTLPERMASTVFDGVAADVLGEMVERARREDRERKPASRHTGRADTVPSPPPTASTSARSAAARSTVSGSSS